MYKNHYPAPAKEMNIRATGANAFKSTLLHFTTILRKNVCFSWSNQQQSFVERIINMN